MKAHGADNDGRHQFLQAAAAAAAGAALGALPLAARELRRGLGLGS